ncbi:MULTISPECIES: CbtA family protein [unclassified Streptomyces]|uniref:CbtA family protein n=1 Tax=unclassified Streptomyces TaxID=2593676 RepID=UPI001BEC2ABD|nr:MULTISPECIES: CbtA family protein [unclassified Streptomyces]MBT2407972.1 CbtA family protein [Streptomyces sp. ISL-21]MBT2457670.1 CbtA family protein [Streptomyces sp. ISL-86]MBT2610533.1 CbtA family protein [Streptomyces sp. ISL-87]
MNSISPRVLLVRGMLAGLLAGVAAFLVAYLLGEAKVDAAIAIEEAAAAAGHDHGEEAPVSRALQATAGLGTGVLLYGVALGGIAALVFCYALGRIGRFGPRATAALVTGGLFVTMTLVPFFKYPANPPAVGDPDTATRRTILYLLMIALSALLAAGALILGRRLAPKLGNWNASVVASLAFIAVIGVSYAFLPGINEVPADFPAALIWQFRLASLAIQAALWTTFGLAFGYLAERALVPGVATKEAVQPTG